MNIKDCTKLVVAPHVDDEVLGLGGIIDSRTTILHLGLAEDQLHGTQSVSRHHRLQEWSLVQAATKCSSLLLDYPVNNYLFSELINPIETEINRVKPDILFIPTPSYNQDHQAAHKACIVATRSHDINFMPPIVLEYIQPQDIWVTNQTVTSPTVFLPVDIERHLSLYKLLASQVRSYRSPDLIKSQLSVFGSIINEPYALAFIPRRVKLSNLY